MAYSNSGVAPNSTQDPLLSKSKQDFRDLYQKYGFDPNGDNEFSPMVRRWQAYLYPGATQGLEFFNGLQPQRRSAIQNLLDHLSQSGLQSQARNLQNQAGEQGMNAARQASFMNRSMGLGDGFSAGNTAAIMGQAAQTQNNISRQYADPQFQSQALAQLLGVYDQAANIPEMQMMESFQPTIMAQNQFLADHKSKGFINDTLDTINKGVQTYQGIRSLSPTGAQPTVTSQPSPNQVPVNTFPFVNGGGKGTLYYDPALLDYWAGMYP